MFKKFLEKKGISMEKFQEMSPSEVAQLQAEFNDEQVKAYQQNLQKTFDEAKKGLITEDALTEKIKGLKTEFEGEKSDEVKNFETTLNGYKETIDGYDQKLKDLGAEITALKKKGVVNTDNSVNKSIIRQIVEKHFEEKGLIGEEEVNENGIKVRPVNFKADNPGDNSKTHTRQYIDARGLSVKHVAQKAGENIFVGGTGTQAVFGQAINRSAMGSISDPLTANQHALDIFSVTSIKGSLMNLLIYQNLEANGELVAEGAAPSADSRIELSDKDFKVFDVSATATVSKNLLADSSEVIDELVMQLESNLKTVLDNYIFATGGDNSATPWGALNSGQSCELFNPLLFTGKSPKADIISVIAKAKLQARLNDWATDSTVLNPLQWDEIEDLKDANENSKKDNRLAVNAVGETIAVQGMMKYQTTKMPDNTLLVFNSNLQKIGLRQDIEAAFGYNNDDFKKRKVSFIIDMRAAYGQKALKSSIYVNDIKGAITILKESAAASLTRVQGYATGSDASALTIATLTNAGVTDTVEGNLSGYQTAVAGEVSIADLPALQALINTVNAA